MLSKTRIRRPSSGDSKTWPPTSTAPPISASRRSWRSISSGPTRPTRSRSYTTTAPARSVACATADVFGAGGKGAIDLAEKVVAAASEPATPLKTLYPLDWPAERKIEQIARTMYGAAEVNILPAAAAKLRKAAKLGYGGLPICMAKTQDSLSDNPKLRGRPRGFTLTVRDVEIAAGAGFLVALTGDIVRMPGLPERPAAERIDVDQQGRIIGLS